jgi:hypothetical protein
MALKQRPTCITNRLKRNKKTPRKDKKKEEPSVRARSFTIVLYMQQDHAN